MIKNGNAAEESAYRWVGSAPCEDCGKFHECENSGNFPCDRRKAWDDDFNTMLKVFEELHES